uniref:C6 domain-containing protein n=1 Tax=Steinernema glaseri TaxID=37863 RepID=A0A1I8A5W7_9BILA
MLLATAALLLLLLAKSTSGCAATRNTPGPTVPGPGANNRCNACGDTVKKWLEPDAENILRKAIERDTVRPGADGCLRRTIGCDGVPNAVDTALQWNLNLAGTSKDTPASVDEELVCDEQARWTLLRQNEKIPITDVECLSG